MMKGRCYVCGNDVEISENSQTFFCSTCNKQYDVKLISTANPQGLEIESISAEIVSGNRPEAMQTDQIFPPGVIIGQYELKEFIGKGGMGMVYKAKHLMLDRIVALKVLSVHLTKDPEFVERFKREANVLAQLHHPNIVAVYDLGAQGEIYYFAMEFVEGTNLRVILSTQKLEPEQAIHIVPQLCEAMEYAHTLGIVHRDIKPENILMDKNGTPKIADFGLAKLILGDKKTEASLTMSGAFMGTAKYMAPEQFKDPKKVDHRADIYSLGAVFYEMLTGELPIGRFQPPSKKVKVDVQLDKVVLKALENEPELRYQRASHMGTDVKTINEKNPSAKDKMVQLKFEIDTKLEGLNQKQKSSIYTIGILVILAIFFFFISHTVSLFLFLAAVLLIWKYLLFKGNGEQHNQHHPAENQIAQQPAKKGLGWYILEILCYLLLLIWVSSVVTTIIAVMWALYPSVDWFGLGGWRGF